MPKDGSFDAILDRAVFDGLTEIGPDGLLRGELATHWQGDSEGRVWQFTLRDGVTFHDGVPLTSDHVAEAFIDAGLPGVVTSVDPLSLRIELNDANPHLPFDLAASDWSLRRNAQTGTGLYRFIAELSEGRRFVGQRSTPHYKDGDAGWPDEIELVGLSDAMRCVQRPCANGYVDVVADLTRYGRSGRSARGSELSSCRDENIRIAAHMGVGVPRTISTRGAMDDGRIAERWWLG